ncbi:MAG: C_GCAxxG_C_C family protein [Dehalococcoidia bacterium]|nr:MAG: C_GCAxxG_C_C family protein [Dehalococcoidia bacterium]
MSEQKLRRIQQRGGDCVESVQGNCAQSVLVALREDFPVIDGIPLNALTVMSGTALRGETCGAVCGALFTIGMLSAPAESEFLEALPVTLPVAARFCDAFEQKFGSLICRNIHKKIFGRTYDLSDSMQQQEFLEAGGLTKCRAPVETASRIVAEIFFDKES